MYHIKWALLSRTAKRPLKDKRGGAAGYDLYADYKGEIVIRPGEVAVIDTNVSYEITEGWHLIAKERGSTGKVNIQVRAGVNDNSYRGGIKIIISNGFIDKTIIITDSVEEVVIGGPIIKYPANKALVQLVPVYSPDGTDEVVGYEELSRTERSDGRLGSSNH